MDKKKNMDAPEIAGRMYQPDDYQKKDEVSSGLATTHEQATDTLTEGQSDPVIEDVNGKDLSIPRKGY